MSNRQSQQWWESMRDIRRVFRYLWHRSWIADARRNHAIEHATIHLLSGRLPHKQIAGRSTPHGFYIYGEVPTDLLEQTVREAIFRLQSGERQLAIHPHCGTNLVTASIMAGVATVLASAGRKRRWWDKLLAALVATTVALTVAQPLGYWVQEHITTESSLGRTELVHIRRLSSIRIPVHFVRIAHDL